MWMSTVTWALNQPLSAQASTNQRGSQDIIATYKPQQVAHQRAELLLDEQLEGGVAAGAGVTRKLTKLFSKF